MKIAILIFDKLTALDVIGPYEVFSRIPGAELRMVAKQAGTHRSDTGALGISADLSIAELPDPDIVLVGGGEGNRALIDDPEFLDWLRTADETTTWTTSVCTGSLVLGAAGILDGKRATSHWAYRERLREYGAEPVAERVVIDGKVVTAAGVSAGIDMALRLVATGVRRGAGAGDPARDRVRPGTAVRLRLPREGRRPAGGAGPPVRLSPTPPPRASL